MSIFRYSGSIYHMAIFAEAIYLVLLLKCPFSDEFTLARFFITISWSRRIFFLILNFENFFLCLKLIQNLNLVFPLVWNLPWILIRLVKDNFWCWQTESIYNLILKIPHTFIFIMNVFCAVYIIRCLYSKIRFPNLTREKVLRYR